MDKKFMAVITLEEQKFWIRERCISFFLGSKNFTPSVIFFFDLLKLKSRDYDPREMSKFLFRKEDLDSRDSKV